jgi:hypothetical protein
MSPRDTRSMKITPHLPSYLGHPLPKGPKGEGKDLEPSSLSQGERVVPRRETG